jgi:hypothetical protein
LYVFNFCFFFKLQFFLGLPLILLNQLLHPSFISDREYLQLHPLSVGIAASVVAEQWLSNALDHCYSDLGKRTDSYYISNQGSNQSTNMFSTVYYTHYSLFDG